MGFLFSYGEAKKTMYSTCKPNKFKGSLCNKMTPDKIVAGGGQKKMVQNRPKQPKHQEFQHPTDPK